LKSLGKSWVQCLIYCPGPDPGGPGKTQEGKKCLGLNSGVRKNPGIGPDSGRSLKITVDFLENPQNFCGFS